ncbi:MAG: hypothetical protein QXT73_05995 [Candidatus Methanomethylicaceae archaeon]
MNMSTALLATVLKSVPDYLIGESLTRICVAFLKLLEDWKNHPIATILAQRGAFIDLPLDKQTLPDAVWKAICYDQPKLAMYPLGAVAERALKKTIHMLLLQVSGAEGGFETTLGLQIGQDTEEHFQASLKDINSRELLKLLVAQYAFELCIDQLRRLSKDSAHDFGFLYHFLKRGEFAPLSIERDMRAQLLGQCKEIAETLCSVIPENTDESDLVQIQSACQIIDNLYSTLRVQKQDTNIVIIGKEASARFRDLYITQPKRVKYLQLHTADANITFTLSSIELFLGHEVHPLVKDLFDIGVSVYTADLYSKREHHLGRCIEMFVPVRYQYVWANAQEEIERAVSFLGRDDFKIRFLQSDEQGEQEIDFSITASSEHCVSLFSGGLDSLAGTVWALEHELKPILVSHYANNRLANLQASLVAHLEKIYGPGLQRVGVYVGRIRKQNTQNPLPTPYRSIMAQYLRSFMFLALAAGVALEKGINTIYVFENGPVALNPMFSEARVNTRTAHPCYLEYFKVLIEKVFGVKMRIENPFLYSTKGEVVNILGKSEQTKTLIAGTCSCAYWFRVPLMAKQRGLGAFRHIHDGICLPCIVRRAALYSAGLESQDTPYLIDIFSAYPDIDRDVLTAVADYLRFCWNITESSDKEILSFAPDFSVYAEGIDNKQLLEMYKRHSYEVIRCFREKSNDELRRCFAPILEQ